MNPHPAGRVNVDPAETARFERLAAGWWDPLGEMRPLHELNPARMDYVAAHASLKGARVLDVGCGGGLLSEALARAGAQVTAIDLAPTLLDVARLHLHESGLVVDYRQLPVEELATQMPGAFDVVTCMELLEHVPDPASIVRACGQLLKPGGKLLLATLNRTPLAFGAAILAAEHVLRLLPRGTHHYGQFIRPSELAAMLRAQDLAIDDISGLAWNPLTHRAWLTRSVAINYLVCAGKPA